jgi:nicotinamidase-related amidase
VVRALRPDHRDYFILKPKHSAFFSTPLDILLEHLGARTLILTGLLADSCILFTAQDAHVRGYRVVVPSDCVAARSPEDHRRAMAQLERGMDADVRPAREVLAKRPGKAGAGVSRRAAR